MFHPLSPGIGVHTISCTFHPLVWHKNMNAALDLHGVHLPSVWAEQMNDADSQGRQKESDVRR